MPSNEIFILTIRLDDRIAYELKEILSIIGTDVVARLTWGVGWLDWLGSEDASQFNHEVDVAPGRRVLVSGERLLELSEQVRQIIEGEFIGYRSASDAREFLEAGSPLAWFTTSPAEMAIEVKDGCFFDVYLRSRTDADRLAKHFQDVRWQDPADFILR